MICCTIISCIPLQALYVYLPFPGPSVMPFYKGRRGSLSRGTCVVCRWLLFHAMPLEPLATHPTHAHHFLSPPLTSYSSQGKSLVSMISRGSNPTESSDPDVRMAYRSICQGGTLNWIALTYEKWSPGLRLSAAGSQGLSELKESIANSEQSVIFAFCRLSIDGIDCFATITCIPENTSGLRRARTTMAARTVQSWFKVRPIPTMDSPIATYSKSVISGHKQR